MTARKATTKKKAPKKATARKTTRKQGRPAKRSRTSAAGVSSKPKARKRVKAAGTRPTSKKKTAAGAAGKQKRKPTKRAAKLQQHKDKCTICNHESVREINMRILACQHYSVIARDYPGISEDSVRRHAIALGLHRERVRGQLAFCEEMMGRIVDKKGAPSYADGPKYAEMAAKLLKKLPDEDESNREKVLQKQVDNLISAIGGLADGLSVSK